LVRGYSINQQAQQLDIQSNTVRAHLKQIFVKTETNSQVELVQLVMAIPVWMGAHAFSLH
jgi:DNA-binding CsgD family transcriptional regulator